MKISYDIRCLSIAILKGDMYMTPQDVKVLITNYPMYVLERNRLIDSLKGSNDYSGLDFGLSSKEERARKKLESIEGKIGYIVEGVSNADLTDMEWSVVDNAMDGKSLRAIGRYFNRSNDYIGKIFKSATKKISDFLIKEVSC